MPFSQAEVEYLFEKRQEMEQETFLKRRQDGVWSSRDLFSNDFELFTSICVQIQ